MVLSIFDCDLCMIAILDLLAHSHSSIPYVQIIAELRAHVCIRDILDLDIGLAISCTV